ncbi:DUF4352 domain-containing protein [Streptomyces sp. R302]|uniref:DUF4352 domain-containing protein n=1 Tax=unclassified Streptomyces TaxID=2593676 RepID=UPI00145CB42E|nr:MULTISPECIES: DUF4352 domain-containing protein [unclassified Streptomyces]NML51462.1 DUF4352 domain-containing protein [Streptomyces sp. R301]NML80040.1 DUF4352 domain-containing protein [Streptomyces sp. R302]
MSDANGRGPGRPSQGGGPPVGPPPGPLSGPPPTPPRRRTWLLALIGVLVLAVGVTGLLIGTGAFGDDDGGGDGGPAVTSPPAPPASTVRETPEATTAAPAPEGPLPFGRTHRYADGVEVTVSAPERFVPSDTSAGHRAGYTAVTVQVTVRNASRERLELGIVQVRGRDGDGREADRVFDTAQDLGFGHTGTLLPGRKAVAAYGFDVPPGTGSVLEVEVGVGFTGDSAFWGGGLP